MGQEELAVRLFTRTTRVSETNEGIQAANIQVFVYDSPDIAWAYFNEIMSPEEWEIQLEKGEGFYTVKTDDYTNTIFLETKKI